MDAGRHCNSFSRSMIVMQETTIKMHLISMNKSTKPFQKDAIRLMF